MSSNDREFLSPADLHDLTGFKQVDKQLEWLVDHGIPHKREGKRIIVSRAHIRDWLAGRSVRATIRPTFARA